jgi:hypothetical protein
VEESTVNATVSLGTMVKQITALHDTSEITAWENSFVESLATQTRNGEDTTRLSDKQIDIVERIWRKHFA